MNTYAEVLKRFPDFAPAQKRLAAFYAEDPQQTAKAYDLAMKARVTLPEDAELGSILAQVRLETWAELAWEV